MEEKAYAKLARDIGEELAVGATLAGHVLALEVDEEGEVRLGARGLTLAELAGIDAAELSEGRAKGRVLQDELGG